MRITSCEKMEEEINRQQMAVRKDSFFMDLLDIELNLWTK
jgi:hypothetical protein